MIETGDSSGLRRICVKCRHGFTFLKTLLDFIFQPFYKPLIVKLVKAVQIFRFRSYSSVQFSRHSIPLLPFFFFREPYVFFPGIKICQARISAVKNSSHFMLLLKNVFLAICWWKTQLTTDQVIFYC